MFGGTETDSHIEFSRKWFEKSEDLIRSEVTASCSKYPLGANCNSLLEEGSRDSGIGVGKKSFSKQHSIQVLQSPPRFSLRMVNA